MKMLFIFVVIVFILMFASAIIISFFPEQSISTTVFSSSKLESPLTSTQRAEKMLKMLNYSDWDVSSSGRTIYHKNGEISIDACDDFTAIYVNYADVTFLFSKEQLSYINAKAYAIITVCKEESNKRRRDRAAEELDKVLRKRINV